MKKIYREKFAIYKGFSLAEALITLLIICVIAIASAPVITKKHRAKLNLPHGVYACYWNGDNLVAKYSINDKESDGKVVYDSEEGRYGCEFNPPTGAKNFVATIVGGGGGGAGAGIAGSNSYKVYASDSGVSTSYTAEETAYYEFLVAGAGGGGGSVWDEGSCANAREGWPCAGSASPGAVVITKPQLFPKGTVFNIAAGQGGSPGNQFAAGQRGGDSYVKVGSTHVIYAQGGGGGFSADLKASPNNKFYYSDSLGTPSGTGLTVVRYVALKSPIKSTAPDGQSGAMISGLQSGKPGGYYYKGFDIRTAKAETATAQWYQFEMPGAYLLDDNWNVRTFSRTGMAGIVLCSGIAKQTTYAESKGMNAGRPYRNTLLTKSIMDEFYVSQYENQAMPFAAGSSGEVDDGACGATNEAYYTVRGGRGVVAMKWKNFYAGLGGSSGSVTQIPYAEMPQKSLLFPGKGGKGGKGSIVAAGNTGQTAGSSGEQSYIKNGTKIFGGSGAAGIDISNEKSYSIQKNDEGIPVGGNGELADVLTSKKIDTGGYGGYNNGNLNNYGLTQSVFEGGAAAAGFNKIFGAGAGGGGGAASLNGDNSENITPGDGGNGTSGLVLIQW